MRSFGRRTDRSNPSPQATLDLLGCQRQREQHDELNYGNHRIGLERAVGRAVMIVP